MQSWIICWTSAETDRCSYILWTFISFLLKNVQKNKIDLYLYVYRFPSPIYKTIKLHGLFPYNKITHTVYRASLRSRDGDCHRYFFWKKLAQTFSLVSHHHFPEERLQGTGGWEERKAFGVVCYFSSCCLLFKSCNTLLHSQFCGLTPAESITTVSQLPFHNTGLQLLS